MFKSLQEFLTSRSHGIPRSELRFARQLVSRDYFSHCDAVLDVGANRGMFCTAVAMATRGIPIHAFEPLPTLHEELARRTSCFPQIELHKCGLGATAGEADLHHGTFHEASSLLPMHHRHQELFPGSSPTAKTTVPISTLDIFLSAHPKMHQIFLKLDVQGYEIEVMKGGKASLPKIMAVLVEVSFEDLYENGAKAESVLSYFIKEGFTLRSFVRPLFQARDVFPISGDCLFVKTSAI